MTEWINVKDRLPELNQDVLVVHGLNEIVVACYEKPWSDEPCGWFVKNIWPISPFYWMPLPEPPHD